MSKDKQEAIKLDYGGKVFSSLNDVGQRAGNVYFLSLLLATGLLLFSAGTIKFEDGFAVFGISISADVPQLLGFGAVAVALSQLYATSLGSEQRRLHVGLLDNYTSLGFQPPRDPMEPSWSALLYPDAISVVTSAVHRGIVSPLAIMPIFAAIRQLGKQKKRPWGLFVRFVVAAVTIFVAVLILLFLPIIAEAWALLRVERIMNRGDFWLGLATVVLLILNTAIVLLLWHGFAERLPETGAVIGAVVLPLLQDLEKQSTITSTGDAATEETPAPNSVN